jgi:hypothetical protein
MEQLSKNEERRKRIELRNAAINKRYEELSRKKVNNAKLYTNEAKFEMLAAEFFLSPRTIDDIIFNKNPAL